jgi:5-formyltetrahydrofolate cyclo-ligase
LRDQLRDARRDLPRRERERANRRIADRAARERALRSAHRIAAYLASDGETDVAALIDWALTAGKEVYLPIIRRDRHLDFARYTHDTPLAPNRLGILEPAPAGRRLIEPMRLDIVLTPLVGFDDRANRLGMGGGFYDRTFARLLAFETWARPKLLGVAFECQRLDAIGTAPWDVPLWRVITEANRYRR